MSVDDVAYEEAMIEIGTLSKACDDLRASLKEMLDHYWGEDGGHEAPDFIKRAQALINP